MTDTSDWYDYLVDSLEAEESGGELHNAHPLPAGTTIDPRLIRYVVDGPLREGAGPRARSWLLRPWAGYPRVYTVTVRFPRVPLPRTSSPAFAQAARAWYTS